MRDNSHHFRGRGLGTGSHGDACSIIECSEGSVMAIVYSSHGVEFIQGYCRRAMIDRWGLYCADPFLRANDAGLARSWAEPAGRGLFLFRPTRLEIVPEQQWMRPAG